MNVAGFARQVVRTILFVLAAEGLAPVALAQPLFTRDLCAPGAGLIGTSWVSLPTHTDMLTAEDLCLAIPGAVTVAQGVADSTGPLSGKWSFDCATGVCTSTQAIPETGCAGSACFCLERGEGVEIEPAAAVLWPIDRCDTFETVRLAPGFQNYLFSVPYDSFLATANDLAAWVGLPSAGPLRGTVSRIDCAAGTLTTCTAATAACEAMTLVPGEAYRIRYTSPTAGASFTNPAACSPIPAPAAATCPVADLGFIDATTFGWAAPADCPLPLVYDAIRGDLACLRGFCTQAIPPLAPPCAGCALLEDDDVDLIAADPVVPAPGAGFWYHARVDGGTWNSPMGPMHCSDLDFMLPGDGCP